jgi:hypothetical protein
MEYLIEVNTSGYKSVTKKIKLLQEPIIGDDNRYHYVYRVVVPSTNWIYVGSRTTNDWKTDKYLGSSTYDTYKSDINNSGEVLFEILSFHENRKLACEAECGIVDKQFLKSNEVYNKSIPSKNATVGCVTVIDENGNTFSVKKDDPRYLKGDVVSVSTNRCSVQDKNGNILQVDKDDVRLKTGELITLGKGKISVKDKNGNCFQVDKDDPRFLSGELVGVTKGNIVSEEMKKIYSEKNKEYWKDKVHHTKGMTTFKDKEGNTHHCKKDDPRVLSGELVSVSVGMVAVKDKNGNTLQVAKDDPRVLSGELVSTSKGNIGWTAVVIINGKENKIKHWAEEYGTTINTFPKYCFDNNIEFEWKNPNNKKFNYIK